MPTSTFLDLDENKKARILTAAIDEFSKSPYEKVSIQQLIKSAGIPRGSFYQYFTDKEDLYIYCAYVIEQKTNEALIDSDVDYTWRRIYSSDPDSDKNAPWYITVQQKLRSKFTDAEWNFLARIDEIPPGVMRDALSIGGRLLDEPMYREAFGLSGDFPESRNDKLGIMAFYLSLTDLIDFECSKTCGITIKEAFAYTQPGLRAIADVLWMPDCSVYPALSERMDSLSLTSVHIIGSSGTDLHVTLPADCQWQQENVNSDDNTLEIIIWSTIDRTSSAGSVSFSIDGSRPPLVPNGETAIGFRIDPDSRSFDLQAGDVSLSGNGLSVVGVRSDGSRVCLADDGLITLFNFKNDNNK